MKIPFLLLSIAIPLVVSKPRAISIKGRFLCHNRPAQYVDLELYHDGWFSNTVIDTAVTDSAGFFQIGGFIDLFARGVDPYLKVRHRCYEKASDHYDPCWLALDIEVPLVMINDDHVAKKVWEFGEVGLEIQRDGQYPECP